ncbi:MAG: thiamine ABC transporter substrate-binding protein [Anaerolineae bacterium]|nr:thiamine ABC transporter substrate-binding protein [Anaerolineae bacterium]
MKQRLIFFVLLGALAALIGCATARPNELVVMTHDSFDIGEAVIAAFEEKHGVKVTILKSGDAGEALNKAILSKGNPLADLFFGVDNTFLSRALQEEMFEAYSSPELENIDPALVLDPQHRLLPVDWGDVCLNYDKAWFADKGIAPPASLEDLTRPEYKGLTVVENPATSSPGLAFLLATVGHFGAGGYLDYWQALRDNGVWVESGWSEAYYGQFTAASEGNRPLVVSYATSPAAEVYYGEGKYAEPPTTALLAPGACFRQIEFVGVLKGTKQRALARAFVDWMLSRPFQEDIPPHMWVFPANTQAELPPVFKDWAAQSQSPAVVSPDEIAANREAWINAWTETVLR